MISLARSPKTRNLDKSVGLDGYRACDRAIICQFQQIVERESDCDYDALATALRKARDPQFVVTMTNLRRAYNDGIYAGAGYATVRAS